MYRVCLCACVHAWTHAHHIDNTCRSLHRRLLHVDQHTRIYLLPCTRLWPSFLVSRAASHDPSFVVSLIFQSLSESFSVAPWIHPSISCHINVPVFLLHQDSLLFQCSSLFRRFFSVFYFLQFIHCAIHFMLHLDSILLRHLQSLSLLYSLTHVEYFSQSPITW